MKKFFLSLIFLTGLSFAFANDTYFFMACGQLVPTKEIDTEIEMKEEIINIVLERTYYEVTVDFFFYNNGKNVDLEIGFPFFCVGLQGEGTISDFHCWTNDTETSFKDFPIEKKWAKDTELENAYVRTINFPEKKITKTRISYKSTYGIEAPSFAIAQYLYGTGSSWKNPIGKMTVRIQNKDIDSYPRTISLPSNSNPKKISDDIWELVFTNIEPETYTDCISIEIGDIFGDNGPRILTKDRYFACTKKLSNTDLFWYTKPQLRYIRNAIYAFHGYPFKSADLIQLFEKEKVSREWFGWENAEKKYYPINTNFTEDELSEIEKYNIQLIYAEEQKR